MGQAQNRTLGLLLRSVGVTLGLLADLVRLVLRLAHKPADLVLGGLNVALSLLLCVAGRTLGEKVVPRSA